MLSCTDKHRTHAHSHSYYFEAQVLFCSQSTFLLKGIQSHGWKYTHYPLPNSYDHFFHAPLLILRLFDIAPYMSLAHPDSSSTSGLSVFIHPKPAPPPSFLFDKFRSYGLSGRNWTPKGHPWVALRPLSPSI